MKKKITLLSLVLFITALGLAQQTNIEHHPMAKDTKKQLPLGANYEQFHKNHPVLSAENHIKLSSNRLKAAGTNKQTLDSLIFCRIDSIGQCVNEWKYEYTYDTIENLTSEVEYDWFAYTNQWGNSMKIEYTYDVNGYLTSEIISDWLVPWTYLWKYEYTYDTNGNLISIIKYLWDTNISQWTNLGKYEYNYDNVGNLTLEINYQWNVNTSQWKNYMKYIYTYDTTGNLTSDNSYNWEASTSQWKNDLKYEYTYDASGNRTSEINYHWTVGLNQWTNGWKYEYTYDTNGNRTSEINYSWDASTSQWINSWKEGYTYDATGNRTLVINYQWNASISQWIFLRKSESAYDLSINISDLILPLWYNDAFFTNKLLGRVNYDWNFTANNWVKSSGDTLYYSGNIVGLNISSNHPRPVVYPNPVSNSLHIDFEGVGGQALFKLFDIQGRKLISQKVSPKEQINLQYLSSGLYIYSITIDGCRESGKLIKK